MLAALLLATALADDPEAVEPASVAVEASEEAQAHLSLPDGTDLWITWPSVLTTERRWRRCVDLATMEAAQVEALDACAEQSDLDARLADAQAAVIREQERALRAEKRARTRLWVAVGVGCAAAAAGAVALGVGL